MDVLELFPEQESFMDSRPGRCRTCAVVGNSNNLLGSHYGAEIDFHDVVMRFNRARIVGYEEDVGNKTTLQLMYPASSMDLDNNTHLMFVPFKTHDLQWLVSAFTPHSIKQFNRARIVGYEEDVGNKTTLQLMYPESAVDLNNNTHLMFVPFKTLDLQWLVRAFTPHSIKQFNRARIVGYEEDVGNKTTLQLMYPESAVDLNNNTHLMFVPFKTHDLQWLVSAFTTHSVKQYVFTNGIKTNVCYLDFMKAFNKVPCVSIGIESKSISTEFQAVSSAVVMTDSNIV
ncbi:hypothetical protein NHX12_014691 [Muraenolepis orangiensis]|uniref:Uncharacterized protein n=1 Tax=Muraenolepis orangiensis TaxID=630683 RepID=A0A9Q0DBW3_9TELE|nr:hypothetical protein NHX12_014691 [Muraenolepis orangiensis]